MHEAFMFLNLCAAFSGILAGCWAVLSGFMLLDGVKYNQDSQVLFALFTGIPATVGAVVVCFWLACFWGYGHSEPQPRLPTICLGTYSG